MVYEAEAFVTNVDSNSSGTIVLRACCNLSRAPKIALLLHCSHGPLEGVVQLIPLLHHLREVFFKVSVAAANLGQLKVVNQTNDPFRRHPRWKFREGGGRGENVSKSLPGIYQGRR